MELCLKKYAMPPATKPDCLLAKYEAGLAEEAQTIIESISEGHRSQDFNRQLTPLCRPIVEAIGNRMVYEIALEAGVDPDLIALYEVGVVKENLSWYIEHGLLTRAKVREMENSALDAIQPRLSEMLEQLNIAPYIKVPILEGSKWTEFIGGLEDFKGNAEYPLFNAINGSK